MLYNFYSPGDEVVENATPNEQFGTSQGEAVFAWDFTRHAWTNQEIAKGGQNVTACLLFFSRCQGGWKFNVGDDSEFIGKYLTGHPTVLTAEEATTRFNLPEGDPNKITNEHIAQFGFFSHFDDEFDNLYAPIVEGNGIDQELNIEDAHTIANNRDAQSRLISHAIPAQSYAVATNSLDKLTDRNFNMETLRETTAGSTTPLWPQERIKGDPDTDFDWFHSDFRDVALPYVYKMYETMLDNGNLRGEK